MSHFSVNIIIPKNIFESCTQKQLEDYIAANMERYDENKEMPRYIQHTRQELIDNERRSIEDYKNNTYAEYLKSPKKYEKECRSNAAHINYLKNEFPLKLNWNEDQLYEEAIKYYEADEIGDKGEVYSTRNPNSKWDWYVIGGRWAGWLQEREKELETDNGFNFSTPRIVSDNSLTVAKAIEANKIPFAIVTPDGSWNEKGKMGWFAFVSNEKEGWEEEAKELYKNFLNDYVITLDCHI